MRLTSLGIGIGLALVLTTTGCSGDDTEPESAPSTTPSTPSESVSQAAATSQCKVASYVPSDEAVVESKQAAAVYSTGVGFSPASTSKGTYILERFAFAPIRVTSPLGPVSDDIRTAVLGSVGKVWGRKGLPDQSGPHWFSLRNDTNRNVTYILYRGAYLVRGTWSAQRCGSPWNDGSEVMKLSGKFSTVTQMQPQRVLSCGTAPVGDMERAASRSCRL